MRKLLVMAFMLLGTTVLAGEKRVILSVVPCTDFMVFPKVGTMLLCPAGNATVAGTNGYIATLKSNAELKKNDVCYFDYNGSTKFVRVEWIYR